jgi:LysM repeat protein
MNKSLIFKALAIILAVVLLQLADTSESKAWGGDCGGGGGSHYVVCYGDTLFSIGRQFNVDPYCVAHANRLRNPNHIYAGQYLYIPQYCSPYPWPGKSHHGG